MWGDMLLNSEAAGVQEGYTCNCRNSKAAESLLTSLDKRLVIADWQYDVKIMKHVIFATPPSLSSSEWSSDLVDFVKRCLVKDVNARSSVDALLKVSVSLRYEV